MGKGEGCNTLNFHPPSLSLSFRPLLPLLLSHLEREEGRELFPPLGPIPNFLFG